MRKKLTTLMLTCIFLIQSGGVSYALRPKSVANSNRVRFVSFDREVRFSDYIRAEFERVKAQEMEVLKSTGDFTEAFKFFTENEKIPEFLWKRLHNNLLKFESWFIPKNKSSARNVSPIISRIFLYSLVRYDIERTATLSKPNTDSFLRLFLLALIASSESSTPYDNWRKKVDNKIKFASRHPEKLLKSEVTEAIFNDYDFDYRFGRRVIAANKINNFSKLDIPNILKDWALFIDLLYPKDVREKFFAAKETDTFVSYIFSGYFKSVFARGKHFNSQTEMLIDSEFREDFLILEALLADPITYLENCQIIERKCLPDTQIALVSIPYDISRVRTFKLSDGREIVSKRIDPLQIRYPEEELDEAHRVKNSVDNISCDWVEFGAQRFIGLIFDRGNFYLLSLKEKGMDVHELYNSDILTKDFYKKVNLGIEFLEHRLTGHHMDLKPRNIIVSKDSATQKYRFVIIDFETQSYYDIDLREGSINKLVDTITVTPSLAGQASEALRSEHDIIRHIPVKKIELKERWIDLDTNIKSFSSVFTISNGYFYSEGKTVGSCTVKINSKYVSINLCGGLKVYEEFLHESLGSEIVIMAFLHAKEQAREQGFKPKWAVVFYEWDHQDSELAKAYPGQFSEEVRMRPAKTMLEKLGFVWMGGKEEEIGQMGTHYRGHWATEFQDFCAKVESICEKLSTERPHYAGGTTPKHRAVQTDTRIKNGSQRYLVAASIAAAA